MFAVFFDFESFMFKGREPRRRLEEIKQRYTRDSVTRAKEIDSASIKIDDLKDSDANNQEGEEEVAEIEQVSDVTDKNKKSKLTFRNRKVRHQTIIN